MNRISQALRALALVVAVAFQPGCSKTDLTVTELSVTSCSSSEIRYSYTILNRDFTGNLFMSPAALGKDVVVAAWISSTQALNEYDGAEQPAGGMTLFANREYGPDELLTPGETVSRSFSVGGSGSDFNLDPAVTPYLILKVDPRSYFVAGSTKDGDINEYSEGNNERFVLVGTCN